MVLPFKTKKAQSQKTAGIFITSEAISLAIIDHSHSVPRLEHAQSYSCESEQYHPVLSILAKTHHLDMLNCCFVLKPTESDFFQIEKPNVEQDELLYALRWSIKDLIDYDIEDVVLDYLQLPNKDTLEVITARQQTIEKRIELMQSCECHIRSIDISSQASRNLIATMKKVDNDTIIGLLNLWENHADISVFQKGDLYINRSTTIGTDSLSYITSDEDDNHAILDNLAIELQRTFDYFESTYLQAGISNIVIISSQRQIPMLDHLIEERLGITCTLLTSQTFDLLNIDMTLLDRQNITDDCLIAIGGALRKEH